MKEKLKNPLNEELRFSIEIGKGYISFDELNSLIPGQCICSNANELDPAYIKINGEILCSGEIIIIDKHWGFKITDIHRKTIINELPFPVESLEQMIPFSLEACSFAGCIGDFAHASENTIIATDQVFDESMELTLKMFGIPLAKGLSVLIDHNLGICIKEIMGYGPKMNDSLLKVNRQESLHISGNVYSEEYSKKMIKHYDFRRPNFLSRLMIKKIYLMHQPVLQFLTHSLGIPADGLDVFIDVKGLDESLNTLDEKDYSFYGFSLLSKQNETGKIRKKTHKDFIEPVYSKYKIPEDLKIVMKNTNQANDRQSFLTVLSNDKDLFDIRNNFQSKSAIMMNRVWQQVLNSEIIFEEKFPRKKSIRITHGYTMCLTMDFFLKGKNDLKIMEIIYPHFILENNKERIWK